MDGWRRIATDCGVPPEIVTIWEKEMQIQMRTLPANVAKHAVKGR